MSEFIASQGETWYDHDFFEAGFSNADGSVLKKFSGYSYVEHWAAIVEERMAAAEIRQINAFITIGVDEPPGGPPYRQVENPCSCRVDGINLNYIGEISHDDD